MSEQILRPALAALAVTVHEGRVLLVRRRNDPDRGIWGYPGGHVESGETAAAAAVRELQEETAVTAEAVATLGGLDLIGHHADGSVKHHYYLVAVECRYCAGRPVADDDVDQAVWVPVADVLEHKIALSDHVDDLLRQVLDR
ncbi:NUDIX hydrolase [Thalassobius sp. Cn5-15]|uniref:NUDIX hydrolase n=1 Tax=Thalassobius sp. Cn5-15 TaxID=2917763 RepID=UPI001EF1B024|nr:NUDIX hydrolase [Thalassobius sp. Cn5-15]MCG7492145.1 NUDIX hydrolase [Thalassobius sp. Cn5-15]